MPIKDITKNTVDMFIISCQNELDVKDIDLANNLLSLKTTKNRKPLVLPITKSLQPILREYLAIRKGKEDYYLFRFIK